MRRHYDPIEVRLGPPHGRIVRARPPVDNDPVLINHIDREDREVDRADDRGPGQFIWRGRIWRVLEVESRWRESGSWWTGPAVRAARGEIGSDGLPGVEADLDDLRDHPGLHNPDHGVLTDAQIPDAQIPDAQMSGDVLCEVEVWRVEAANGRQGSRGIYDLAHSLWSGQWHLRGVFD